MTTPQGQPWAAVNNCDPNPRFAFGPRWLTQHSKTNSSSSHYDQLFLAPVCTFAALYGIGSTNVCASACSGRLAQPKAEGEAAMSVQMRQDDLVMMLLSKCNGMVKTSSREIVLVAAWDSLGFSCSLPDKLYVLWQSLNLFGFRSDAILQAGIRPPRANTWSVASVNLRHSASTDRVLSISVRWGFRVHRTGFAHESTFLFPTDVLAPPRGGGESYCSSIKLWSLPQHTVHSIFRVRVVSFVQWLVQGKRGRRTVSCCGCMSSVPLAGAISWSSLCSLSLRAASFLFGPSHVAQLNAADVERVAAEERSTVPERWVVAGRARAQPAAE